MSVYLIFCIATSFDRLRMRIIARTFAQVYSLKIKHYINITK